MNSYTAMLDTTQNSAGGGTITSHPLEVDVQDLGLPTGDRVHLSRLRCRQHTALQTYQLRLGNATYYECRGVPDMIVLSHRSREAQA